MKLFHVRRAHRGRLPCHHGPAINFHAGLDGQHLRHGMLLRLCSQHGLQSEARAKIPHHCRDYRRRCGGRHPDRVVWEATVYRGPDSVRSGDGAEYLDYSNLVIWNFFLAGTHLTDSVFRQAETLPARKRERFGTLQYLLVCTGASVSYWMNYALSYAGGQFEWRFAIAAQLVFAVMLLAIIPFMPESPQWLIMQDRNKEAIHIVKRMHGVTNDDDEEVQTELKLIHQALELEMMAGASGFWDLFKMGDTQNLRRIILGWWMMAMVMWSGVCSIGYYISYLFETSVGLSHNLSLLLSGFNGLCK